MIPVAPGSAGIGLPDRRRLGHDQQGLRLRHARGRPGDLLIRAGEHEVIVAGGMESMSNAPYLLKKARFGYTMGDGELIDHMTTDGLTSTFTDRIMAEENSVVSAEIGCSRAGSGRLGAAQPPAGVAAIDAGRLAEEIVPVTVPGRKGDTRGRGRRGAAPRHVRRAAGGASAGVQRGRRDHGRKRAGRERRRGGAGAGLRGLGAGATA